MKKLKVDIKKLEKRLDNYNHIMELVRTVVPIVVLTIQILILIKLN